MKSFLKICFALVVLLLTWALDIYHVEVYPIPQLSHKDHARSPATFINKADFGINQLIVEGTPYQIGLAAGEKTKELLYKQENELITQLRGFFPNPLLRKALEVLTARWFWGIEKYFEPWMIEEMYGVSQSTSHEFDYLGTPLTRQVAYHGLHEVGQLAVDQGGEAMGCTVIALKNGNSWIIGRNFDFEGGRIFDTEKIMKWVFPQNKYAFLSVIWAGMVGAVTGINEKGVYISLNAAGSTDFSRWGTPSTLLITKALMNAQNADEAVEILKNGQMFITDIFVVSDRVTGKLFRVEKSPSATEVIALEKGSVVTNHLISPRWQNDKINRFRADELTSTARSQRGEALIRQIESGPSKPTVSDALKILRDKGINANGEALHLGNRRAIDALIATHSVIYSEKDNTIFVSRGPGVSGEFMGFDLAASFKAKKPVKILSLPADPLVTPEIFQKIRLSAKDTERAQSLIKRHNCQHAKEILDGIPEEESSSYYSTLGNYYKCIGETEKAKKSWKKSLALTPAYPHQEKYLRDALR
jgi:predicted choloylglycine hydrolase